MRGIARRLPYVRELRDIVISVDSRLAALESLEGRLAALETRSRDDAARELMQQTLPMVSEFWSACDCRIDMDKSPILIDLLHGITEYLWRNLVVAKLVQHITRAPLVGLLGKPGVLSGVAPYLSRSENIRLASAFGVAQFVEIPEGDARASHEQSVRAAIEELATQHPEGTPLPPTAISLLRKIRTEAGFPIGRSVQETFMRAELQPTILAGDRLLHWTKRVLGFHAFAEQLISTLRPSTFVTGHIDYCPWGTLAELLARRGGRVVWSRMECRLPIHLLDHVEENGTLNGTMRRIERDSFAEFECRINGDADLCNRVDAVARARSAAVCKGLSRHFNWVTADRFTGIPTLPFDSRLPNYCLFTHTFTDQPAADEALFVDYLEWIEETCRHAAATRAYNLIVKIHPRDREYDCSGAADRLATAFDAPNIHFTRDQIEPEQLAKYCSLGLTVRGTPGLEMTSLGLPMMLAGRGPYSDTGLCLVPATRSEYFELLKKGPPFPIDIAEQSRRARLFMTFDRHWSPPMSGLVPSFSVRNANDPNLWILIADGVRSACLETDQAARSMSQAWPKGSTKVIAPELEELFRKADSG
jgi:hypothetical protein